VTTQSNDLVTLNDEGWARILVSHGAYHAKTSPVYDEVLSQVAERVRVSGDIGKADIGALLFWKRLRADTPWVSHLMTTPDATVRATTARALSVANDLSLPLLMPPAWHVGSCRVCLAYRRATRWRLLFCWLQLLSVWQSTTGGRRRDWASWGLHFRLPLVGIGGTWFTSTPFEVPRWLMASRG
jgi:hypothetical protein